MDDLLKKIKHVERQSITDIEQAKLDRDESIRITGIAAEESYDLEIQNHSAKLKAELDKNVEGFKEQAIGVVENGKLDSQKAKQIPAEEVELAAKAVYELIIRG